MSDDPSSFENFAITLEKLKLPKTANILREELEKKNKIQKIEKTLASNPLITKLMQKLETPKVKNKKIKSKKEESKQADNYLLSSKSNLSLLDTKIFKKLYDNFDNQKMNQESLTKLIQSDNTNTSNLKSNDQNKKNKNNSEILSNSEIKDNKNTSILNTTNNNEEDSIFTNENASNIDDSNVTQFNPQPKKLNPRPKKNDNRDRPFAGNAQLDKMLKINQIKFNQSGV